MTSVTEFNRRRAAPALGTFERYLTVWVALCIIAGIVLGRLLPGPFQALGRMTVAEVNIPVAILIWLMIVPMLLKVDFGALHRVAEQWRGIAVTVGINWLGKRLSMVAVGWLFVGRLFRPWLPAARTERYLDGLILVAGVRLPGRGDRPSAPGHRAFGRADRDPGLFERWHRLWAQPAARGGAQRGLSVGADRRLEFL